MRNSLFFAICGPIFTAFPSFHLWQGTLLPLLLLVTSPSIHFLVSCFVALYTHLYLPRFAVTSWKRLVNRPGYFFPPFKKTVSEYQTKMSTQAQNGYLEAFFLFSLVTQLLFRTVFTLDAEKSVCLEYVHMYIESLNTAMFLFQIMSLLALDFLIWYYRLFLCY